MSKCWRRTVNKRQKKKESGKQLEVYIGHNRKESKAYDRKRHELDVILIRNIAREVEEGHPEWKRWWPNRCRQRTARKNGEWNRQRKRLLRIGRAGNVKA